MPTPRTASIYVNREPPRHRRSVASRSRDEPRDSAYFFKRSHWQAASSAGGVLSPSQFCDTFHMLGLTGTTKAISYGALAVVTLSGAVACSESAYTARVTEVTEQRVCFGRPQSGCTPRTEMIRFGLSNVRVGDCYSVRFERESTALAEIQLSADCTS